MILRAQLSKEVAGRLTEMGELDGGVGVGRRRASAAFPSNSGVAAARLGLRLCREEEGAPGTPIEQSVELERRWGSGATVDRGRSTMASEAVEEIEQGEV